MKPTLALHCSCMDHGPIDEKHLLSEFSRIRGCCAALRLLVPDAVWSEFKTWDRKGDHDAFHRSICLLALDRGHLGALTKPIHRFLLDGDRPRTNLRAQYVQDLSERWMLSDDPLERHAESRGYMGRIVELQCATWLESQGWNVTGLEALRSGPDIEACRGNRDVAFEVKAIGASNEAFGGILESLRGGGGITHPCPDTAINYLVFRAYECARQLRSGRSGRIAILAIDQLAWHDYRMQLEEGWIDWSNPLFLGCDPDWQKFIASQGPEYSMMHTEMGPMIQSLDAIWIMQRTEGYEYHLEHVFTPGHGASV